jgi:hypothetical protein
MFKQAYTTAKPTPKTEVIPMVNKEPQFRMDRIIDITEGPYRVEATKFGYKIWDSTILVHYDMTIASPTTNLQRAHQWLINAQRVPGMASVA